MKAAFSFLVIQSLISFYYLDSCFTLKPVKHPFFCFTRVRAVEREFMQLYIGAGRMSHK